MTRQTTILYIIASLLALAFVQRFLPETPVGFAVFFLVLALFAHPIVKWPRWWLVPIGAAIGGGVYFLVKRYPLPTELSFAILVLLGVGAVWEAVKRRRQAH